MNSVQKLIKYFAMALAAVLIVSIFGGIITALAGISYFFSDREEPVREMQTYSVDGEITSLSVKLSGTMLEIKTADKFSVESNHAHISVETKDGQLSISETKKVFSGSPKGLTVVLNIPEGFAFDEAEIEAGAGTVKIEELTADTLKLSLGAGETKIKNLTANSKADIDGGAGALTVEGGALANLDLDMGVGKLILKSRLEGDSKLDYGIGETELTLLGDREDYRIEIDKGIGEATVDGEHMQDEAVYGSGENRIEIDGGIGAIEIEFLN